jgi:tight adherence protein B
MVSNTDVDHSSKLQGGYQKARRSRLRESALIVVSISSVYSVILIITGTLTISIAITSLSTAIPFLIHRNKSLAVQRTRDSSWPEAIDSLVSALQSGIAIPDAVCALATRGPLPLKALFLEIESQILSGEEFTQVMLKAKSSANSAIADQVFETLLFAKDFGGKDSNAALRLLSEFVREDLAVLEEIRTKFGWIRNSANLAAIAPWLLLILLSTQGSTREAFSTTEGIKVLSVGVVFTGIAYLWMERVGKLPVMERALK